MFCFFVFEILFFFQRILQNLWYKNDLLTNGKEHCLLSLFNYNLLGQEIWLFSGNNYRDYFEILLDWKLIRNSFLNLE